MSSLMPNDFYHSGIRALLHLRQGFWEMQARKVIGFYLLFLHPFNGLSEQQWKTITI